MIIKPRSIKDFPSLAVCPNPKIPDGNFFYRPYLGDNQTLIILDLLRRLKPKRCFEYGAGYSTAFFPWFFPETEWISVEHLNFFVEEIKIFCYRNTRLVTREIWNGYPEAITIEGTNFDFVFVDGERREECIELAAHCMNPGGVIIRHDAGVKDEPMILRYGLPENDANYKKGNFICYGQDARRNFRQHGVESGLWWGVK